MAPDTLTQPLTQIYKPQLLDFRSISAQGANAKRVGNVFELTLRSAMNGQFCKLTLRGPKDNKLRPLDEAELRQRFSGDYAALSIFLDRNSVEFWIQTGFLSAIHCASCGLECAGMPNP
ncbi:MAG TPA: hypothetical protein VHX86_08720 [Tepidisphaeraceae bacterium]|jgi:hypothetical protein|nr:hypothetical protein [Tepidisphaeraceae bacterium]